ncbi:MAG: dienelactone hydrolase family protein [Pseudomonadota bacterium]
MSYLTPNAAIPAVGGDMAAYLAQPSAAPRATVIMQVELWGMTQHMKEVADRLAGAGYAALVIDLFRGAQPPVPTEPVENWGKTFEAFDDVRATLDCRHALSWLLDGKAGFDAGSVFAWGFCMGGRFAHNLAVCDPRLAGAINFYGRINFPRLQTKPFLPIELTRLIECPYLGAFAAVDGLIPPEDVNRLRDDLRSNTNAQIDVYDGTEHAFFNDHRDAYHAEAAQLAWDRVCAFLDHHAA